MSRRWAIFLFGSDGSEKPVCQSAAFRADGSSESVVCRGGIWRSAYQWFNKWRREIEV